MASVPERIEGRKIGLALGSGSARGWAHFGVFQALEECGVRVDYVAGTSIGALAGAVFASGTTESFLEIVPTLEWKRVAGFFDWVLPRSGLIDGRKIASFVREHVHEKLIEDLPIPFAAVATDLLTGTESVLDRGDVIEAVRASMAFPGILTPVRCGDQVLTDGGLVNPIPVDVVRRMGADIVIAVDLNHDIVTRKGAARKPTPRRTMKKAVTDWAGRRIADRSRILTSINDKLAQMDFPRRNRLGEPTGKDRLPSIFEVLFTSISILEQQVTAMRLAVDPPDLLIQPALGHIRLLEFNKAEEGIRAGYEEAMTQLDGFV